MSYLLYYNPNSANLVIRMALEELGLDYEDRFVERRHYQRDEAFHKLNPRGLLPVLVDRQTEAVVFETGAALLYLAERHGRLAPPMDRPVGRADFLKWLFLLSNTLHADLRLRFYSDRFVTEKADVPSLLHKSRERILNHLGVIEESFASHGGPWLLASGLSVCDIYLGCCVRWTQMFPADHRIPPEEIMAFPKMVESLTTLQDFASIRQSLLKEDLDGPAFIDPEIG
ncbi:MAG: glutathione S-transferase family protein [Pseudomonadota bacterium]